MATPENIVKAQVKKIIASFGSKIDGFWPVPSGYGESHLDWVGCVSGTFVAIETKAPGKKPTPRQLHRIELVRAAGGYALIIDGTDAHGMTTYDQLNAFLMLLTKG